MRLERSVDPPWIQCTTWCAALHFAGRSQPGQRQWPSRVSRARRAGPETVRFERPPSITLARVILAGFASQRLQRRAHGRPAHGVEDSVEHIGAVLPHAQVEAAILDLLGLLGGVTLGVGRMPDVTADVVELAG